MVHLDYRDARPIYTQIFDGFRDQILTGILPAGEKLPSVRELAAELDCKVYIHEADLSLPPQFTAGTLYYTDFYKGGITIEAAGLDVFIRHTPGHTPGSVCLLVQDVLFSGDTLFAGSCGRTDLPGGDWATITKSLKRLAALEGNFWVYSGHGPTSTLRDEKKYNPYMR